MKLKHGVVITIDVQSRFSKVYFEIKYHFVGRRYQSTCFAVV